MTIPTFTSGQELTASELNNALADTAAQAVDNVQSQPNTWQDNQAFQSAILQSGAAGAQNESPLLNVGDAFSDFIASGMQWAVPSSASLTTSMTSGSAYLNSVRTLVPAVSGYSFPASNDTYVSVNNSGVPAYQSVANGAAAPAPNSGYVQTAKVVTSPIQSPTATLSTSTSGSLASGTYGIALVAFDATGYGTVGASGTVTVTSAQSGSGSIELSWVNPLNETGMDIYATTAGSTTLGLVASGVTGTTYTYTGSVAPGAAAPTVATSNAVQSIIPILFLSPLSKNSSSVTPQQCGGTSTQAILTALDIANKNGLVLYFPYISGGYSYSGGSSLDIFSSIAGIYCDSGTQLNCTGCSSNAWQFNPGTYAFQKFTLPSISNVNNGAAINILGGANLVQAYVGDISGSLYSIVLNVDSVNNECVDNTIEFNQINVCSYGPTFNAYNGSSIMQGNVIKGNFIVKCKTSLFFNCYESGTTPNWNGNYFEIQAIDALSLTNSNGILANAALNAMVFKIPAYFGGFSEYFINLAVGGNNNLFEIYANTITKASQINITGQGNMVTPYGFFCDNNKNIAIIAATATASQATFNNGDLINTKITSVSLAVPALTAGEYADFYVYHAYTDGYTNKFVFNLNSGADILVTACEDESVVGGVDGNLSPNQIHIRVTATGSVTAATYIGVLLMW